MMDSKEFKDKANQSLKLAEHMLTKTYPMVNDPKLILAISEDIHIALLSIIKALLGKGAELADFERKAQSLNFQTDEIELVKRFDAIIKEHKDSPVEFSRKDKFVICDDDYNFDSITLDDMKKYLFRARLFVEKVEAIICSRENS